MKKLKEYSVHISGKVTEVKSFDLRISPNRIIDEIIEVDIELELLKFKIMINQVMFYRVDLERLVYTVNIRNILEDRVHDVDEFFFISNNRRQGHVFWDLSFKSIFPYFQRDKSNGGSAASISGLLWE